MEHILEYIVAEGLIMIPVLYILAEIIKPTQLIKSRYIPVMLLIVSLGFTPLVLGGFTADNTVQAVLVTGVTVLGYELYKESIKGDE